MKLNTKNKLFFVLFLFLFLSAVHFRGETKSTDKKQEIKILHALHSISSHVIFEDVK